MGLFFCSDDVFQNFHQYPICKYTILSKSRSEITKPKNIYLPIGLPNSMISDLLSVLPIIWFYANLYNTYLNPIFTVQWVSSYSTHCRRCQYHFLPSPLQYFLSVNVLRACNGSAIAMRQNLKRQRWREVWFRDIS